MLFFYGCKYDNKIEVINCTDEKIDSLFFISNRICKPLKITNIGADSRINSQLINCGKDSGDGSFEVIIYQKDKIKTKTFGYFTNGYPIFIEMKIYNYNDSIRIVEEY